MTRLATSHGSAQESPGLLLWQVTNRWQAAVRASLKPFELTHVQFVLLASLTYLAGEGVVSQKQLADHAATDPMMTSQVLRTLESKGWVARDADPHDGRAKAVRVTAEGSSLANRAVVAVEQCDRDFFVRLDGDLPALTASLRMLADSYR
ncbi:DNA-binding MarR family transcriptional regulator [Nakamurella sp. UYEF19]|uniref:MarR family winged helix-turn-helix transcriptional regulator n=1 Tax=Nakamurella sp. UYEF19 TaxID=1756392 RepID=UPI00339B3BCE